MFLNFILQKWTLKIIKTLVTSMSCNIQIYRTKKTFQYKLMSDYTSYYAAAAFSVPTVKRYPNFAGGDMKQNPEL